MKKTKEATKTENLKAEIKAIIYCRVSSKAQELDGDGLGSQEHRCRQYAAARGYLVERLFTDTKTAGGDFMKRPGMVALLEYLRLNAHTNYVVIFDDLKRFARDTEFHIRLRTKLALYGATRECLNFRFEDTPEGKFVETIIAAQGELERSQNQRQTVQKMKARVERGYHAFKACIGYKFIDSKERGRILVRDEPFATILQNALEGYASGALATQVEVKRYLESFPEYPRDAKGEVRAQQVYELLTRTLYAGYVEAPTWGVSLRKGNHDPLVSFETHVKIRERLNGNAKAPARKDLDQDFPLRGSVLCGDCGSPLTATWARGRRGGRYPYYHCFNKRGGCASYGKSIKRDVLEGEFRSLLGTLEPRENLFRVARLRLEDLWKDRLASGAIFARTLKTEVAEIEKAVEHLLNRIVSTNVDSVVAVYEKKIRALEEEKIVKLEQLERCGRPVKDFHSTVRTALTFLENPCSIWDSGRLEYRRAVLRLAFAGRLTFTRNSGLRTPELAFPFKLWRDLAEPEKVMAEREGFEPS
jgi:DNA invertase Pin-like site-specific DNA recombinase